MRTAAIVLLLFASIAEWGTSSVVPGLSPATSTLDCSRCKDRGVQPCSKHSKSTAEFEYETEYCSEIADCKECQGVGFVDCAKCDDPKAAEWIAAKLQTIASAPSDLEWIEEGIERPVLTGRSKHFVVAWDLAKLSGAKKAKGKHGLMHLYLARLESLMTAYKAALGSARTEFKNRLALLVWGSEADQKKASEAYCTVESEFAIKLHGAKARLSLAGIKSNYRDDDTLYQAVAHEFGHLLPSAQKPASWVGDKSGGWLDAGFAHWFEEQQFGACEEVCYNARYYKDEARANKWRGAVKKLISQKKLPEFGSVMAQNTETMTFEYHLLSFSWVEFLIARDAFKFDLLMKLMRRRTPARDALFEAFQLSMEDFEDEWSAWARETY